MSDIVKYEPKYIVSFFSDKEKYLTITEKHYKTIEENGNDVRFIKIEGNLYNLADIKSVTKKTEATRDPRYPLYTARTPAYPSYAPVADQLTMSPETATNYEEWKKLSSKNRPKFHIWLMEKRKEKS